ncbi:MAG TPA: alkaline phosphatase family protein [Streptosporangiaceae bacterium]|nr:alkaline phosphatase family protein [Streptosporangiaceae bacterium]
MKAWFRVVLVVAVLIAIPTAALAVPRAHRVATPIQHVVVLYMENHSFDNVLGYWCDQLAQNPGQRLDGCVGMPTSVTLSNGATVTPSVAPDTVPNEDHNIASQLAAIDNGKMDGWENIVGCAAPGYSCVSGYEPSQIPNITSLAQKFAVSDHTFSMADSPSWGGHLYAAMASLDGFTGDLPAAAPGVHHGWGCDSGLVAPWINPTTHQVQQVPSCVPDPSLGRPNGGAFEPTPASYAPTIMDRLQSAGLTWKIYGAAKPINGGRVWAICPSFAECLYTSQDHNLVDGGQFAHDAATGLSNFSIVTPGGTENEVFSSCHNLWSMTDCDNWIGQLVREIEHGPDWNSTAVFITFDDMGGFYDQVPPPSNQMGTQEGPRVPMIIVSPYAKAGYTDSTPTSFAGILAFTEHNFGLAPLSPIDAAAYPFTNAFNYSQAPLKPVHMVHRPLPPSARHIHVTRTMLDDPT